MLRAIIRLVSDNEVRFKQKKLDPQWYIDCFACHASVPRHNKLEAKQENTRKSISIIANKLEYMVNR